MITNDHSLARQLQAVGHILDERGAFKEVLVHQADDGFIVHALEIQWGHGQSVWTPVTILIEANEVKETIEGIALPAAPAAKAERRWWR